MAAVGGISVQDPASNEPAGVVSPLVAALMELPFINTLPDRRMLLTLVRQDVVRFPHVRESHHVLSYQGEQHPPVRQRVDEREFHQRGDEWRDNPGRFVAGRILHRNSPNRRHTMTGGLSETTP